METNDLIYLVSCAVNDVKPDPERVAGMDLDAIYKLACRHMLAATVAPALKAAGVEDARFAKALEHSALKSSTMDMEMESVFTELDAAGIWHMPLKGIVLQHYYPVYGMRQMSDHDFLIDAERAEDIKTIMEGLGFQIESFGASKHDVYYKPPVSNFQMHRTLFEPNHDDKLFEYYKDVEKRLFGDGCEKHLSPEDFYLYIIAHEYEHYSNAGTGLRSVLDTYVYLQKITLDMAYVTAEAEKLGIARFEVTNRSLALHLFSGESLTETDTEMLNYILDSGIYGTVNHRVENKMRRNGWGKFRYALGRFAVPVSRENREYAAFAAQYPFFYQHKVLLPFLPFYRILRAMKAGRFQAEAKAIKNAKKA